MSVKKQFDWTHFDWPNFQKLCLHLAETIFEGTKFEEYLRQGHKQDGIDLISVYQPGPKVITIQCKKEQKLKKRDVQTILIEFEKGRFCSQASDFVIATSAELDGPTDAYLRSEQIRFRDAYQIELRHWDKNFLEERLKGQYTLVSFFFNKETAEAHCHRPTYLTPESDIPPVADYIPRTIFPHRPDQLKDPYYHYYDRSESTTLTEVIAEYRLKPKHVCLIADAYQGKTLLLKHTEWALKNEIAIPYTPLMLECKNIVLQNIPKMLEDNFGQWKSVPGKDLVVLIDGMDEVPADKFLEMVAFIRSFHKTHKFISLVFSCRKIFYEHYELAKELTEFNTYELNPLGERGKMLYIKSKLPGRHEQFIKKVEGTGLEAFLYHPFFLTTLVSTFANTPGKLPNSKAQVLEEFIDKSLNQQRARKISGGKALRDSLNTYKLAIQRLAIALQLTGLNAMKHADVLELFSSEEVELLKINTLVSKHNDQWSFTNALFQEHLAALQLLDVPYDKVIAMISVGNTIKKVRTKWIETTSSLLSLMQPNSAVYQKLLLFVEQDNIELLFTTEKSKFTPEQRTALLKKLLDRCTAKQIRPILIYEEKIASFVDGDEQAIQLLVKTIFDSKKPSVAKYTAAGILKNLNSLLSHKSAFYSLCIKELKVTDNLSLACGLIAILTEFKLGDKATAQVLISNKKLRAIHSYRSNIYQYLLVMGWVDDYYDFGLLGVAHLNHGNREIYQAGANYWFDQFLIETKKVYHLKRLIYSLSQKNWQTYLEQHASNQGHILRLVMDKAVQFHKTDPTITIAVCTLLRNLSRKFRRDNNTAIDEYFRKTNDYHFAIIFLIEDLITDKGWALPKLIREESFDYLLAEWENSNQTNFGTLRSWYGQLRYNQVQDADKFFALLDALSEKKLYADVPTDLDDYELVEKQKKENDKLYIQDQESFRKGIESFFHSYGSKQIPEEDIYVHFEGNQIRKKTDSNYLFSFLVSWISTNKVAKLSTALNFIKNKDHFEYYRAHIILQHYNQHEPLEEKRLSYLRDYLLQHLSNLSFVNVYREKSYKLVPDLVGKIFDQFEFDVPTHFLMELVWLDQGGIHSFESNELNRKRSLSQKIMAKLTPQEEVTFSEKIISNLKTGILSSEVLGNHLALCRHYKLQEATEIILDILYNNKSLSVRKQDLLKLYVDLGGELSGLLPFFKKMRDYSYDYFKFVSYFINDYPKEVHASLKKCFALPLLAPEMKVAAAQHLCTLGNFSGFEYLVSKMKETRIAPYSIQSFTKLTAIETKKAINLLKSVEYFLVGNGESPHFSESPKNLMTEWLTTFAMKGEGDLKLVIEFYDNAYENLKKEYPNAHDLFWYQEQVIEKFRGSDKASYSIKEVKKLLL